ncbi:MAG: hypothetical protein FWD27_01740 [Coriobacteriia bacterium]|nr:hypothetical protein [Coriobacteriia bacterium]
MSISSKRIIFSLAAGIATVFAYTLYVCIVSTPATEDIAHWAILMLIFIIIGVVLQVIAQILIYVLFSIKEEVEENVSGSKRHKLFLQTSFIEDERDRLISLKAIRIGYACAGTGLFVALVALACGAPFVAALHIIVGAGALGSLIEGCASIYFHERGISNG